MGLPIDSSRACSEKRASSEGYSVGLTVCCTLSGTFESGASLEVPRYKLILLWGQEWSIACPNIFSIFSVGEFCYPSFFRYRDYAKRPNSCTSVDLPEGTIGGRERLVLTHYLSKSVQFIWLHSVFTHSTRWDEKLLWVNYLNLWNRRMLCPGNATTSPHFYNHSP